MFNNFNEMFGFILIVISIILRFVLLILKVNVLEFNFLGVVIPFDFSLFFIGIVLYLLYKPIPKKNILEVIKFYEKFKSK
jgi:hypothetical protein